MGGNKNRMSDDHDHVEAEAEPTVQAPEDTPVAVDDVKPADDEAPPAAAADDDAAAAAAAAATAAAPAQPADDAAAEAAAAAAAAAVAAVPAAAAVAAAAPEEDNRKRGRENDDEGEAHEEGEGAKRARKSYTGQSITDGLSLEEQDQVLQLSHFGRLRSFRGHENYGFIDCRQLKELSNSDRDIFVHSSELKPPALERLVTTNQALEFRLKKNDKGQLQAISCRIVSDEDCESRGIALPPPSEIVERRDDIETDGVTYYGRIKSFLLEQGYGFIESDQAWERYGKDVFIHKNQITRDCNNPLSAQTFLTGMQVSFEIQLNKDQRPQARYVSILPDQPWEVVEELNYHRQYSGGKGKGKGKGGSKGGKGGKGFGKGGRGDQQQQQGMGGWGGGGGGAPGQWGGGKGHQQQQHQHQQGGWNQGGYNSHQSGYGGGGGGGGGGGAGGGASADPMNGALLQLLQQQAQQQQPQHQQQQHQQGQHHAQQQRGQQQQVRKHTHTHTHTNIPLHTTKCP